MVLIPKTIAIWMTKDIVRARYYEQELEALQGIIDTKDDIIYQKDSVIASYARKTASYDKTLGSCDGLNKRYEREITGLNRELRKETNNKRFWRAAAIILPTIVGTVVYMGK